MHSIYSGKSASWRRMLVLQYVYIGRHGFHYFSVLIESICACQLQGVIIWRYTEYIEGVLHRTSGKVFDISNLEHLIESILACQLYGVFRWCFNTCKLFYTERFLVACSNRVYLCTWVYLCMPAILALQVVEVFYTEHLAVYMFEKNI